MGDDPRAFLAHLVGATTQTQPVAATLLAALGDEPTRVTTLAEQYDTTRQHVYRALDPLVDARAVVTDRGQLRRTGLGAVLTRVLEAERQTSGVTRAGLAFCTASLHRVELLQQLRQTPADKAALATAEGPSRTTVHRAIDAFQERGWVEPTASGEYTTTPTGTRLVLACASALTGVEHALARAPLLMCCDSTVADIPLAGLAAADQYELRPEAHDPSREIHHRLDPAGMETYRAFMSVVSRDQAETGDEIIRSAADTEIIITERVLYNLPAEGPYAEYVKRGLEATNLTLLVVPEVATLPVGLSIIDGEQVIIGPADLSQSPDPGTAGIVMGTDPALVAWCDRLYERYREQARSPARQVIADLKRRIPDSIPTVSRTGEE